MSIFVRQFKSGPVIILDGVKQPYYMWIESQYKKYTVKPAILKTTIVGYGRTYTVKMGESLHMDVDSAVVRRNLPADYRDSLYF